MIEIDGSDKLFWKQLLKKRIYIRHYMSDSQYKLSKYIFIYMLMLLLHEFS